jgi:2-dehydro-3-deoxygluconokinase
MARLAPPGFQRLRQALPGMLEVTFAGAEANVAASLAIFGLRADFVTALPHHAVADACVGTLRGLGVGVEHILRTDGGRLGWYFLETGANQRPSQVIYDREGSAVSLTPGTAYDWQRIFEAATWFHVTGITPALSSTAAQATLAAVCAARENGVTVSCDLNFRKKLWRWNPDVAPPRLAEQTMRAVLPNVDVLIANEEDCADVLGIHPANTDVAVGQLDADRYPDVARQVVGQFPNISQVAITLRESLSASHNNWGGMLYRADMDEATFSPREQGHYRPYAIRNIVDRVGGGDAFAAGLIFALNTPSLSAAPVPIDFAVAASCLAHSIPGDFNFTTRSEVEKLMQGARSGRVER